MSDNERNSPRDEPPPELVDPITLAVMEDAVMVTPCGHSFSTSSITAWLRQQGSSTKVCPVCKSTINDSLVPNWALRNAVDRYNQKYGKRRASSSTDDAPVYTHQQLHIDLADYPVKPSAPPVGLNSSASSASDSSASSAPSFHAEEDLPAGRTFTQAMAATSLSSSPSPLYAAAAAPANQHQDDDGSDCECCADRPTGKRGCCVWECAECGVCKMADDCSGPGCLLFFPTTTVTCQGSFGTWSNWYSRTICGSIFPIFVALVLLLLCVDLVIICVFWTLWSLLIPLGMLFFLMTHYFCPCVNRGVDKVCGSYGFFVGQICPS